MTLPQRRPIRPDDEAFLARLYASTRAAEMALVDWPPAQKEAFLLQQFQAQHRYYQQQFSEAEFSLLERDGQPIGRLYIDRRSDELRLIDIALLPAHRNAGLGGALLRELLAEAAAAAKPVRIHVEHTNPALRLYRRLGFQPIEDKQVYLLLEWRPPPAEAS